MEKFYRRVKAYYHSAVNAICAGKISSQRELYLRERKHFLLACSSDKKVRKKIEV